MSIGSLVLDGNHVALPDDRGLVHLTKGDASASNLQIGNTTGISAEADIVITGNVIESTNGAGIQAGWGAYLHDVSVTANIVRGIDYGIAVSVVSGAGTAMIANNLVSGARLGAIVGREWAKTVSSDLSKDATERYAQLTISGTRVR